MADTTGKGRKLSHTVQRVDTIRRTLSNADTQDHDAATISARIRALAQQHVSDAVLSLAEIAGDSTAPAAARVSASKTILEFAGGKAVATVESSHTETSIVQLHLASLESLSQGAKGPVIEHDPS